MLNSDNDPICFPVKCKNHFCRETTIENDRVSKFQTLISNSYWIRQSFYILRVAL